MCEARRGEVTLRLCRALRCGGRGVGGSTTAPTICCWPKATKSAMRLEERGGEQTRPRCPGQTQARVSNPNRHRGLCGWSCRSPLVLLFPIATAVGALRYAEPEFARPHPGTATSGAQER